LPIGMSEDLRTSRVKVYCPRCEDVYIPKKSALMLMGHILDAHFHIFCYKPTLICTPHHQLQYTFQESMVLKYIKRRAADFGNKIRILMK